MQPISIDCSERYKLLNPAGFDLIFEGMKIVHFLVIAVACVTAYSMHSHHIFVNCYDPICNLDGIYGFHCKNGICNYICSEAGCRQDGMLNWSMIYDADVIFNGCKNPNCAMDGFYGYGCADGACHYICSVNGCIEIVPEGSKGKFSSTSKEKGKENKPKKDKKVELPTATTFLHEEVNLTTPVTEKSTELSTTPMPTQGGITTKEVKKEGNHTKEVSSTQKSVELEEVVEAESRLTTPEPEVTKETISTTNASEKKEDVSEAPVTNPERVAKKKGSGKEEKGMPLKKTLSGKAKPGKVRSRKMKKT